MALLTPPFAKGGAIVNASRCLKNELVCID